MNILVVIISITLANTQISSSQIANTNEARKKSILDHGTAKKITVIFSEIGEQVSEHHVMKIKQMESVLNNERESTNYKNYPIISFEKADLNEAITQIYNLVEKIKNQDGEKLHENLKQITRGIPSAEHHLTRLEPFLPYLDDSSGFRFSETTIWLDIWESHARIMARFHQEFETFRISLIEEVNFVTSEAIKKSIQSWKGNYSDETSMVIIFLYDFENYYKGLNMYIRLKNCQISITKLSEELIHLTNPIDAYAKINFTLSQLENPLIQQQMVDMEHNFYFLTYLLKINNEVFTVPSTWINAFKALADFLIDSWDYPVFIRRFPEVANRIDELITDFIYDLVYRIRQHYKVQAKNFKSKVEFLNIEQNQIQIFLEEINRAINTIKTLINKVESITEAIELGHIINESELGIRLESTRDVIEKIKINCVYLNVLHINRNENLKSGQKWARQFHSTVDYLEKIRIEYYNYKAVYDLSKEIEIKIEKLMENFTKSLDDYYRVKLSKAKAEIEGLALESDLRKIAFNLITGSTIISNIIKRVQNPLGYNDDFTNTREIYNNKNYIKIISFQVEILKFILVESKVDFQHLISIKNESSNNFEIEFKNNFSSQTSKSVDVLLKSDLVAEAKKIVDHYEDTFSAVVTDKTLEIFNKIENAITDLLSATTNENYDNLLSYLNNVVDSVIAFDIDKAISNNILHKYTYFENKQALSDGQLISLDPFNNNKNNNFPSLENALNLLIDSPIWNAFLLELDEKLSQYEFQSDASKYNEGDWGIEYIPRDLTINNNNFFQFLDKLNIRGEIRNVHLTDSRLKALNNVLAINLRNEFETICDGSGDQIILQSRFIKFSDFVDEKRSFRNPCSFKSRNINIYASKTVFVDRSLSAIGIEFNMAIVAPKWEVVGDQSIKLDGGETLSTESRASDGSGAGAPGTDGNPGAPGSAAGHFFGVGTEFINGKSLHISANGGKGGRGQDGGNGAKGRDGQVVTIEHLNDPKFTSDNGGIDIVPVHDLWDRAADTKYEYEVKCGKGDNCDHPNKDKCECVVWGKQGQSGGRGGIGGPGGVGGKAGKVEIEEIGENASGIKLYNANGEIGDRGHGGKGGDGGSCNRLTVEYTQEAFYWSYYRSAKVSIRFLRNEPINDKGLDGDQVYLLNTFGINSNGR